jgi:hypothetical protein
MIEEILQQNESIESKWIQSPYSNHLSPLCSFSPTNLNPTLKRSSFGNHDIVLSNLIDHNLTLDTIENDSQQTSTFESSSYISPFESGMGLSPVNSSMSSSHFSPKVNIFRGFASLYRRFGFLVCMLETLY